MSSLTGNKLKISLFGESHGNAIGVVIDGLPSGFEICEEELDNFLKRRATGKKFTTKRKELDRYEILSGYYNGKTTGTPLTAIIRNIDQHSKDYKELETKMRPSHADYTGYVKYGGFADNRGGGHFSGRITAGLCVAGGIALQMLKYRGIEIYAHISSLYDIKDTQISMASIESQRKIGQKEMAFIDDDNISKAQNLLEQIINEKDSIGGTVEIMVHNVKAGYGNPIFDGVESKLSSIIFAIPAIKGVEFGSGFECANMKGSHHNDPFRIENDKIITTSNNSGGINGGITNGMPIIIKAAVKPTASIGLNQDTIDIKSKQNVKLSVVGRHDPAIILRIVPVLEAAVAIGILDLILENEKWN